MTLLSGESKWEESFTQRSGCPSQLEKPTHFACEMFHIVVRRRATLLRAANSSLYFYFH